MAVKEKEGAQKYINPYNFVSLDTTNGCSKKNMKEVEKNEEENKDGISEEQKLTGYVECTLETRTPIILPDIKSATEETLPNGDKHPHFNFFNYDEKIENTDIVKPVIPGSEIRGMLRSDFEILTNSCMSSVNMDKKFIARTTKIKKPGLLKKDENGNWHLYEAKRVNIRTTRRRNEAQNNPLVFFKNENNEIVVENEKRKTGEKVFLSYREESNGRFSNYILTNISLKENNNNSYCGYLFIGEDGAKKRSDSIFILKNEISNLNNLKDSVEALQEIYDMYNDEAINKNIGTRNGKWYPGYNLKSNDYIPVWYDVFEHKAYLSLASIGKEAYFRNLNSLLNVGKESYSPCIDKTNICEACYLFGYVSSEEANGSKIRVSDANYEGNKNPYLSPRTLQELSTPRTSNPTFYSLYLTNKQLLDLNKNEKFWDWNYDYKYSFDRNTHQKITNSLSDTDIKARGRKAYWHHDILNGEIEKTKRNCTAQPVKENSSFKFKVYFEKISDEQLKHLIATLTLKYNSDKKCTNSNDEYYDLCHKIGRGKPLGYGSVKIKVDNVMVKELTVDTNNRKVEYNLVSKMNNYNNITINDCPINKSSETFKDVLKMYNFNYIKENYGNSVVNYPVGEKRGDSYGYLWFMLNRSSKLNDPHVYMVLPKISEGGDVIEGEEKLNGRINQNENLVLNIDGLNMPILQEIDDHNNSGNNNNRNNRGNNNNNHNNNNNNGQNNRNNWNNRNNRH